MSRSIFGKLRNFVTIDVQLKPIFCWNGGTYGRANRGYACHLETVLCSSAPQFFGITAYLERWLKMRGVHSYKSKAPAAIWPNIVDDVIASINNPR